LDAAFMLEKVNPEEPHCAVPQRRINAIAKKINDIFPMTEQYAKPCPIAEQVVAECQAISGHLQTDSICWTFRRDPMVGFSTTCS